jgi:hypothetical protein
MVHKDNSLLKHRLLRTKMSVPLMNVVTWCASFLFFVPGAVPLTTNISRRWGLQPHFFSGSYRRGRVESLIGEFNTAQGTPLLTGEVG